MKNYLFIILLIACTQGFSQNGWKSTQYGITAIKKGNLVIIGSVTVYNNILWVKFDYELAEEFDIKFIEKTASSKRYYVDNEKATGCVTINHNSLSFDLFIKNTKQHKTLNYKIWH